MPKVHLIHMDRIRLVRNRELYRPDALYLKALETGDQLLQNKIAFQKQILRDIFQGL